MGRLDKFRQAGTEEQAAERPSGPAGSRAGAESGPDPTSGARKASFDLSQGMAEEARVWLEKSMIKKVADMMLEVFSACSEGSRRREVLSRTLTRRGIDRFVAEVVMAAAPEIVLERGRLLIDLPFLKPEILESYHLYPRPEQLESVLMFIADRLYGLGLRRDISVVFPGVRLLRNGSRRSPDVSIDFVLLQEYKAQQQEQEAATAEQPRSANAAFYDSLGLEVTR